MRFRSYSHETTIFIFIGGGGTDSYVATIFFKHKITILFIFFI